MSESERHNAVLKPIMDMIVRDGDRIVDEASAMVILESVTAGVMMLYRPNRGGGVSIVSIIGSLILAAVLFDIIASRKAS